MSLRSFLRILLFLSLPFFMASAYEMYILTLMRGPQLLGFWMAHNALWLFIICAISGLAYLFALLLLVVLLVGGLLRSRPVEFLDLGVFTLMLAHIILFLTYSSWSGIFK